MTQKHQVTFLPLNQISPNPFQPRDKMLDDDAFKELVSSVTEHGILEPLVVADTPAGYQLIAGERRWRAAQKAGLTEAPVHLLKTTPKGMLEMALVENIQRVNLNALDRAQAIQRLQNEFNYSPQEIAQKLGKSASYIANSLRLLNLPDPIKDGLNKGLITEAHARALSLIPRPKDAIACYRLVLAQKASSSKTEQMVRHFMDRALPSEIESKLKKSDRLVEVWRTKLQSELENDTDFNLRRSNLQTRLIITLKGNAKKTQTDLEKIMKMMGVEEEPEAEELELLPPLELN